MAVWLLILLLLALLLVEREEECHQLQEVLLSLLMSVLLEGVALRRPRLVLLLSDKEVLEAVWPPCRLLSELLTTCLCTRPSRRPRSLIHEFSPSFAPWTERVSVNIPRQFDCAIS